MAIGGSHVRTSHRNPLSSSAIATLHDCLIQLYLWRTECSGTGETQSVAAAVHVAGTRGQYQEVGLRIACNAIRRRRSGRHGGRVRDTGGSALVVARRRKALQSTCQKYPRF
eukprot:3596190-Prymnesium_polylepis.1